MRLMNADSEDPPDVVESMEKKQRLLLFSMAVGSLRPGYRRIFDLRFNSCNSVKEIALKTGKTEKSVENTLRRIKEKLKENMIAMGDAFFGE